MIIRCPVSVYINTIGCHRPLHDVVHAFHLCHRKRTTRDASAERQFAFTVTRRRYRRRDTMATRPYCVRQEKWTRRGRETWPRRPRTILTRGRRASLRLVDKTNSRVGSAPLPALHCLRHYECTAARHARYNTACRWWISDRWHTHSRCNSLRLHGVWRRVVYATHMHSDGRT